MPCRYGCCESGDHPPCDLCDNPAVDVAASPPDWDAVFVCREHRGR